MTTAVTILNTQNISALSEGLKIYLKVTVNDLYLYYGSLTGPTGLPFNESIQKIKEFIPSCNGEIVKTLSHNIIETLNASKLWGEFGDTPSLEFKFNPQYYNSSFLQCLFNKTNEYAENYHPPGSTFLTTTLYICLTLAALICVGCCIYGAVPELRQYYYENISNESAPLKQGIFNSKQEASSSSLQEFRYNEEDDEAPYSKNP